MVAPLLAAVLTACGIFADVGEDPTECDLKPIGTPPAGLRLGVQKVAALCEALVEIEGTTYSMGGGGGWLDEDALVLEEYGIISRANTDVYDPAVFALEGVDPLRLLVARVDSSVDYGEDSGMGRFWMLWGEPFAFPEDACRYADAAAADYPGEYCPLSTGRRYSAQMVMWCGLDVPVGPYGGEYWTVVDPPPPPASGSLYPGMAHGIDYGEIELLDADRVIYRSELGAELELLRITGTPSNPPCDPRSSTSP
jgi:hypothetical protein